MKEVWGWVFLAYLTINVLLFLSMVFLERKKLSSVISWTVIITVLPGLGYIIYAVFGSGLSIRVRRLISRHKLYAVEYDQAIKKYFETSQTQRDVLHDDLGIVKCCYNYGGMLCPANEVKFFTSGEEKLNALLNDIENAKKTINIEYYIFADDETGKKVMNALIAKAKQGVKVRLIFDSVGSLRAPRRYFRKLKKAGGEVAEFFPPFLYIRLINLKLNYRNHRKIVVIDGKIAYTGGINLRNDHMGKKKKVSPWRDTHIRIEGTGVFALQNIFLNDWRYVKKESCGSEKYIESGYFQKPTTTGSAFLQVLASGPDSQIQNIKETYIKLLTNAKKEILIQTPYFIPDEPCVSALRVAIASGVKVKIMVPNKPDYKVVFWATTSYLKEFSELGAEILFYDGFLHAKTLVVDDNKLSVGTCNFDNRSFGLNFEDTVIIYDESKANEYREIFENDASHCIKADAEYFKKKRWLTKFAEIIFRLFSPIF